jgi:hypothetical protein
MSMPLKDLLVQVVETFLPDESIAFSLHAEQMINDAMRGKRPEFTQRQQTIESGFGPAEVLQALQFVSVTLTTVKVVLELRAAKVRAAEKEVAKKWANDLVAEGVDPELAKSIADRFAADLRKTADGAK